MVGQRSLRCLMLKLLFDFVDDNNDHLKCFRFEMCYIELLAKVITIESC